MSPGAIDHFCAVSITVLFDGQLMLFYKAVCS